MPSSRELQSFFNKGALRQLLAKEFGGKTGRLNLEEDSDFIMSFDGPKKTPDVDQVGKAVKDYYTSLGYEVEEQGPRGKCFEALISHERHSDDGRVVSVVITVPYPHDGNRANLRASCETLR